MNTDILCGDTDVFMEAVESITGPLNSARVTLLGVEVLQSPAIPPHMAVFRRSGRVVAIIDLRKPTENN